MKNGFIFILGLFFFLPPLLGKDNFQLQWEDDPYVLPCPPIKRTTIPRKDGHIILYPPKFCNLILTERALTPELEIAATIDIKKRVKVGPIKTSIRIHCDGDYFLRGDIVRGCKLESLVLREKNFKCHRLQGRFIELGKAILKKQVHKKMKSEVKKAVEKEIHRNPDLRDFCQR